MNDISKTIEDAKPLTSANMLTLNVIRQPIDQTWTIERIASEVPPRTWESVFENAKAELHDVSLVLEEQEKTYGSYYPSKDNIFKAFEYTQLTNVRIVIIGQDPYHQTININNTAVPRAVGLSFSVRREDAIPSSLQNIYTEVYETVRGFVKPDHGDLREWARQGVLLLNTCLTVRPHQAGSHGDIWLGFMSKVFKAIAAVNPYCIYMLWGREAQKLRPMLGERSNILEAAHPSGFSARRGFFGCNHFNKANDILILQGKIGVNWRISSREELMHPTPKLNIGYSNVINNGHQPKLTPVNVNMLPAFVTNKSNDKTGTYNQDVNPYTPKVAMPSQIVPLLPTIPNIKSKMDNSHIIESNKPPSPVAQPMMSVPLIPKINFGVEASVSPPITISVPQIIPVHLNVKEVDITKIQLPLMIGLPTIQALVK